MRLPRPRARALAGLVAAVVILGAGFLWLRDSSLVAVQKVSVLGVSGPDAAPIRAALRSAARNMTTLDVRTAQLQSVVAPYPVVKHLEVSTQFPHGMQIRVIEQVPVAMVTAGVRRIPVSGDGTLLHGAGAGAAAALPVISLRVPPGGARLSGYALSEVHLLAAAPYPLLARVRGVQDGAAHGLTVWLRNGPSIYFGAASQLGAKWTAATAVLGNSGSAGSVYIDVTDPHRPAAGAGTDANSAATSASTTTAAGAAPPVATSSGAG